MSQTHAAGKLYTDDLQISFILLISSPMLTMKNSQLIIFFFKLSPIIENGTVLFDCLHLIF